MGTITRSFANNITTSGVLLPASLDNNSIANVTSYNASIVTGNMVLISSQTASNSASISFTSGLNSTYKEYQFWFIDIHPRSASNFQFQTSTNGGSSYGVTTTNTLFKAYTREAGDTQGLGYDGGYDLAQSSGDVFFTEAGNEAISCVAGSISLFNPSSTTYVKHYIANVATRWAGSYTGNMFTAGYFNSTSALNAIIFRMSTGNMDGTILMYGIV
jgi:hypothetical protein